MFVGNHLEVAISYPTRHTFSALCSQGCFSGLVGYFITLVIYVCFNPINDNCKALRISHFASGVYVFQCLNDMIYTMASQIKGVAHIAQWVVR